MRRRDNYSNRLSPFLVSQCLHTLMGRVTSQILMEDIKVGGQCKLNSLQLSPLAPGHRAHMHVHSWIQVVVEQLEVSTLDI